LTPIGARDPAELGEAHRTAGSRGLIERRKMPESEYHPCRKKAVTCTVIDGSGKVVSWASNSCRSSLVGVCAREAEGCHGGERYELCGPPKHAEVEAAAEIMERLGPAGLEGAEAVAHIQGNTYVCRSCSEALLAVGVRRLVLYTKGA